MRGFAVPLLLIVVVLLGGAVFYFFSVNSRENIKGVSTSIAEQSVPGVMVSVIADSPAWDLVEYVCVSAEECLASLNAGKRVSTVGGGATELREVKVNYSDGWEGFSYLKLYVRPSGLAGGALFSVVTPGDVPGTALEKISNDGESQDVVLVPLDQVSTRFYKSATFSDR